MGARDGYECFTKPDEDGNCIFLGAQFYPRLAVYSDYEGWHNKAFLDGGEFTLEFGDYDVSLTVPADHVVAATGVLQNPETVLSPAQRERLTRARTASEPLYVVTPAEALAAEKGRAKGSKTWRFTASNVRDFAFASSRKFVWDAMGVKQTEAGAPPLVMAMSFYPKEGRPLWDAYSTKAVAHTLKVYGNFAVPYPYPVAQSVNGPVGGMEYPMISFNGPRPIKDKQGNLTYSERTKNGLIGVVIHEVGHNWFPMIINSDERQWTWMDEGLNTFLQFQAEMQWDKDFKTNRGEPRDIVEYMISADQVPIMTQSDSLKQFGNNAYGKPATALVILRETVMGRDLFDEAFKTYARRWRFKHPTPYDFFRTMEEVSGIDLDWFWRGWFYSTDHVDISLDAIVKARLDSGDPAIEGDWRKGRAASEPRGLTTGRNTDQTVVERDLAVRDYFNSDDRYTPTKTEIGKAKKAREALTPEEREAQAVKDNFYRLTFSNLGGLVMPIPLKLTFEDGSIDTVTLPAEIWRRNSERVTWQYVTPKTLAAAEVDPRWEIADADRSNNTYPRRIEPITIEVRTPEDRPDRMKGNRLTVTPDSLAVQPAKAPEKDADKEDAVPTAAP
jgi:aminopeptidase N